MSSSIGNTHLNFLEETYIFPEDDFEQYDVTLRQYLSKIARNINTKDSGLYIDQEVITGQKFVPTYSITKSSNVNYRDVFRKVIDFGALPDTTTKSVAHGITTTQNYSIVRFYANATDPGVLTLNSGISIPHVNVTTPADGVQLDIDETNIDITTTTANYTNYTKCFATVEYIKEE